jgi:hypothetical protein
MGTSYAACRVKKRWLAGRYATACCRAKDDDAAHSDAAG